MKKIHTTFLFCLSLFFGFVQGQTPMAQIFTGEKSKGKFEQFLEEKDHVVAVLLSNKNKYYIRRFNSETLELEDDWELPKPKYLSQSAEFVFASESKRGYHLIFEVHDAGQKTSYLLEKLVHRDGKAEELRLLAEVSPVNLERTAQFAISQDSSKLAIYMPPVNNKDPKVYLFDEDWNLEYEKVIEIPVAIQSLKITDVSVTNKGDVLVVAYQPLGNERKTDIKPSTQYVVAKISKNNETKVFRTKPSARVYHNFALKADLIDNLLVTATYSEGSAADVLGMLYLELDPDNLEPKVEQAHSAMNSNSNLNEDLEGSIFLGWGKLRRGFAAVQFSHFARFSNGNVVVSGERDYFDSYGAGNHVFGELVVMSFNSRGELVWIRVVPKVQNTGNVFMESYSFHKGVDAVYLFYNDDLGNAERINKGEEAKRAIAYGKNFGVISVQISEDGEMFLQAMGSVKDTGGITQMRDVFSSNSKNVLMSTGGYLMSPFKLTRLRFL